MAYHFHWPYEQIMNLDHFERIRWVKEIAKIVDRLNAGGEPDADSSDFRSFL